ncbi:hypothetical protein GLW05_20995 [Pontibacillus yanchengensis]|uniref:Uncharacterized protein n=1 Tax=Pontibacillus yanchengensis TaxID=462910 RepID=A0A6I5A7D2_9BACI|nr:hypothetical protein [Pontibacillus yanchengensis]MYL36052.1 hypothetical protein [Pontibacillus yanchengensis]
MEGEQDNITREEFNRFRKDIEKNVGDVQENLDDFKKETREKHDMQVAEFNKVKVQNAGIEENIKNIKENGEKTNKALENLEKTFRNTNYISKTQIVWIVGGTVGGTIIGVLIKTFAGVIF